MKEFSVSLFHSRWFSFSLSNPPSHFVFASLCHIQTNTYKRKRRYCVTSSNSCKSSLTFSPDLKQMLIKKNKKKNITASVLCSQRSLIKASQKPVYHCLCVSNSKNDSKPEEFLLMFIVKRHFTQIFGFSESPLTWLLYCWERLIFHSYWR